MSDVLIVDDDPTFRMMLKVMLQRNGVKDIVAVESSSECLLILIKNPPKVLIMDINMPYVSGMQILDAIKSNKWLDHVNVIVVTGSEFVESSTSVRRGAIDYFLKPITESDKFILLIKHHLALEKFKES